MKITLIKPKIGCRDDGPYIDEARMEPLQLGVLAGLTPPDVELVMHDDRFETVPFDDPTDLVAITVETFTARRSYQISAEYRRRGVPVIMGGMQPTLLPAEVSQHADAIYIGDAETGWQQVLADARRGSLQPVYRAEVGPPQAGSMVNRDIFYGKTYLPVTLLQYGRGCRYECTFCATSAFFNKQAFYRAVDEVLEEIDRQQRSFLFFVDDNIISDQAAAKLLFKELIPLKIKWVSQASINMTQDRELMSLMAQSGCLGHVVGFESLARENLISMKKGPNAQYSAGYREELAIVRDHGLQIWAAFTFGHEHDTPDSIKATVDFALEQKFSFAAFNTLVPYPGTPLYAKMHREERLLYGGNWWLHPDYRFNYAAFVPAKMTPDELTEACFAARSRFNSFGALLRRMLDFKTNMKSLYRLGLYLGYNKLFKKEVFKKHGMRLGETQAATPTAPSA